MWEKYQDNFILIWGTIALILFAVSMVYGIFIKKESPIYVNLTDKQVEILSNAPEEIKLEITNVTTTDQGIYIQGRATPNTKIRVNVY